VEQPGRIAVTAGLLAAIATCALMAGWQLGLYTSAAGLLIVASVGAVVGVVVGSMTYLVLTA
jgi:hypothetical protein